MSDVRLLLFAIGLVMALLGMVVVMAAAYRRDKEQRP